MAFVFKVEERGGMQVVVAEFEGGDSGPGSRFYWQKQENMSCLFL